MNYDAELRKFRNAFRKWKILDKYEWISEDWTGKRFSAEMESEEEEYFFCYLDLCMDREHDELDPVESAYVCVYLLRDGRLDAVLYWGNESRTFERGDFDGVKNYINDVLTDHGYE